MIVNHSRKVIFVANPKTGSTSVEAALAGFNDEHELDSRAREGLYTKHHITAFELREMLGQSIWRSYYKFTMVRNPWDWFVSQHFYNLQKLAKPHDVETPLAYDDIVRTEQFLRIYRGCEWANTACQNAFVCDESGRPLVDYIGRYEDIDKAFSALSRALGATSILPRINASLHRYYKEYYSAETRELVRQLYCRDISLFGYEF
jgi:Sulfotransferase family